MLFSYSSASLDLSISDYPLMPCPSSVQWSYLYLTIPTDSSAELWSTFLDSNRQLSGVMRAAACLVLVLPRRSHMIDAISDCGGSTFPHESSSNSVCWLFGVSTGLHSAPPYLTDYFILVVAKDGQVYDQRLLARWLFHASRLWQSAHGHSQLDLRLLGTISRSIFVIQISVFLVSERN